MSSLQLFRSVKEVLSANSEATEEHIEKYIDNGKGSWLLIPKSDYIDALAAGTARGGNLAMDNSFRLGPGRSTRSRRTLSRSVSMICPLG